MQAMEWLFQYYSFNSVSLCGTGETTLCLNFEEIIDYCTDKGIKQFNIVTNCSGRPVEWYINFFKRNLAINWTFSLHTEYNNYKAIQECYESSSNCNKGSFTVTTVLTPNTNFEKLNHIIDCCGFEIEGKIASGFENHYTEIQKRVPQIIVTATKRNKDSMVCEYEKDFILMELKFDNMIEVWRTSHSMNKMFLKRIPN